MLDVIQLVAMVLLPLQWRGAGRKCAAGETVICLTGDLDGSASGLCECECVCVCRLVAVYLMLVCMHASMCVISRWFRVCVCVCVCVVREVGGHCLYKCMATHMCQRNHVSLPTYAPQQLSHRREAELWHTAGLSLT